MERADGEQDSTWTLPFVLGEMILYGDMAEYDPATLQSIQAHSFPTTVRSCAPSAELVSPLILLIAIQDLAEEPVVYCYVVRTLHYRTAYSTERNG